MSATAVKVVTAAGATDADADETANDTSTVIAVVVLTTPITAALIAALRRNISKPFAWLANNKGFTNCTDMATQPGDETAMTPWREYEQPATFWGYGRVLDGGAQRPMPRTLS